MIELGLLLLLLAPAVIGQTYFVYRYARYSSTWRDSSVGRALMSVAVTLAVMLNVEVVSTIAYYSDNVLFMTVTSILEFASFVFVTVAILWQVVTLVKTQNKEKDHDGRMGEGRG